MASSETSFGGWLRGSSILSEEVSLLQSPRGGYASGDVAGLTNWQMKYLQVAPEQAQERLARWNDLVLKIVQRYQQYQVPLILLRKETPKEAVCQVFEKVNTGGVSLTVFELLTATYAVDDYPLREDWEGKKDARGRRVGSGRRDRLREHNALSSIESTDFLQAITLLATYFRKMEDPERAVSCKRKDILRLALSDYQKWAEPVTQGFEKAAKLLRTQKIFGWRDLPYRTQIVPLAAILTALQDKAENDGVRAKLARWYWCGVFGELYGSAVESRFARDLPEVLAWIDGGPEPSTVAEANFAPARLLTLRTRNSAAYKGLHTLLLRDGGQDFRTGEPVDAQVYFDDKIDIHHVFPKNWCKTQGIGAGHYESIVNKTPLAARTNRIISDKAPSAYLSGIQKSAGISEARMDEILSSHVIEPSSLRADDFDAFFKVREQVLLERIEKAMDKAIVHDVTEVDVAEFADYEEEVAV